MHEATLGNDPFYSKVVKDFYRNAVSRHPKFPVFTRYTHGIATCLLPTTFDHYFKGIEGSARRNYNKAVRANYTFSPIDYNAWLSDVTAIRRSTDRRQGFMPQEFLTQPARPVIIPPSTTRFHAYPYFGVQRDGMLVAYASCLVAGEMGHLEHICGHAGYLADGVVPLLLISIAEHLLTHHPTVRYYVYGGYFGAQESMRRFKTKFRFNPHRITWVLERKT
jgi:hypothetical protein